MSKAEVVAITSVETAELIEIDMPDKLGPDEVRGRTLYSMISAGTELAGIYSGKLIKEFPCHPGYAAVFEITEVGENVENVKVGDRALHMGPHRSFQQASAQDIVIVPEDLAADKATFARMIGVSMTAFFTVKAKPPDLVMVTGLGPVGYMAAEIFRTCNFDVIVVDPDERRRNLAKSRGFRKAFEHVPVDDESIKGKVAVVIECSGHEQAAIDGCKVVRKLGEVILVGVPWERRTELYAHELLSLVFHNFIILRSGWEWELPNHPTDFQHRSRFGDFAIAMRWLNEGEINVEGLYSLADPRDCQQVYQDLLHNCRNSLFTIFDWT